MGRGQDGGFSVDFSKVPKDETKTRSPVRRTILTPFAFRGTQGRRVSRDIDLSLGRKVGEEVVVD